MPLWVVLIAAFGLTGAAAAVGAIMVLTVWWLSGRYLGRTPASMGLLLMAGGASVPLLLLGVVLFGLGLGNATSLPPLYHTTGLRPC